MLGELKLPEHQAQVQLLQIIFTQIQNLALRQMLVVAMIYHSNTSYKITF
jgi:hypothetical protein